MAEKDIKMAETEDDDVDIAISMIGNKAGFTAGYYKGEISLKARPKGDKKEINPVSTIVSNIFGAWWKAKGASVRILERDGGKKKIRTTDNIPSDIAEMDRYWTIDKAYTHKRNLR